jgi:hypothetical protein
MNESPEARRMADAIALLDAKDAEIASLIALVDTRDSEIASLKDENSRLQFGVGQAYRSAASLVGLAYRELQVDHPEAAKEPARAPFPSALRRMQRAEQALLQAGRHHDPA